MSGKFKLVIILWASISLRERQRERVKKTTFDKIRIRIATPCITRSVRLETREGRRRTGVVVVKLETFLGDTIDRDTQFDWTSGRVLSESVYRFGHELRPVAQLKTRSSVESGCEYGGRRAEDG
ncbi:uncharacterized protein LOC126266534 [Aethina tumida]|uniref:uncharacterized protein LOC126266534 n=1 Tax=Aethina tumida TaxID=116153 RepID=UPI00214737BA|nr:uncharacterized protein LOC126266534 [Aethina tumida]